MSRVISNDSSPVGALPGAFPYHPQARFEPVHDFDFIYNYCEKLFEDADTPKDPLEDRVDPIEINLEPEREILKVQAERKPAPAPARHLVEPSVPRCIDAEAIESDAEEDDIELMATNYLGGGAGNGDNEDDGSEDGSDDDSVLSMETVLCNCVNCLVKRILYDLLAQCGECMIDEMN